LDLLQARRITRREEKKHKGCLCWGQEDPGGPQKKVQYQEKIRGKSASVNKVRGGRKWVCVKRKIKRGQEQKVKGVKGERTAGTGENLN